MGAMWLKLHKRQHTLGSTREVLKDGHLQFIFRVVVGYGLKVVGASMAPSF